MSKFLAQEEGRSGLVGIFQDDGDTGTFYLYDSGNRGEHEDKVLVWMPIYKSNDVHFEAEDVWIAWSIDFERVGLILGRSGSPKQNFRAVIDAKSSRTYRATSYSPDDESWIKGFEWTWTR